MKFIEEEAAQGALEYLLMLAGAIFVAITVGLYLKGIVSAQAGDKLAEIEPESA